jgi:hypothetical protein
MKNLYLIFFFFYKYNYGVINLEKIELYQLYKFSAKDKNIEFITYEKAQEIYPKTPKNHHFLQKIFSIKDLKFYGLLYGFLWSLMVIQSIGEYFIFFYGVKKLNKVCLGFLLAILFIVKILLISFYYKYFSKRFNNSFDINQKLFTYYHWEKHTYKKKIIITPLNCLINLLFPLLYLYEKKSFKRFSWTYLMIYIMIYPSFFIVFEMFLLKLFPVKIHFLSELCINESEKLYHSFIPEFFVNFIDRINNKNKYLDLDLNGFFIK